MFQGHRVILKSRVQVSLGEVAGVARLREEAQIRQLQLRDNPCNGFDRGKIGLPLQMGMDEHQADKQHADARQAQGQARFPQGKASPALFISAIANQGF
jgi:hypothetical protein